MTTFNHQTDSLTQSLSDFGRNLKFSDLSSEAVLRTKNAIIDCIGCMVAGTETEQMQIPSNGQPPPTHVRVPEPPPKQLPPAPTPPSPPPAWTALRNRRPFAQKKRRKKEWRLAARSFYCPASKITRP
jgi:hypothetical protein